MFLRRGGGPAPGEGFTQPNEEPTPGQEPTKTAKEEPEIELHPPEPEPEIELHPPEERGEDVQIDIAIPEKLAQEILPTVRYLFKSDKESTTETPQEEYQRHMARRNNNPTAILLDPDRVKTGREEQRIDQLVEAKIREGETENREEALKVLFNEHIYAPPRVQQYMRLMNGLSTEKPIDVSFLRQKLQSRREHEDGMLHGESPHWRGPEPPTRKQKKEFKQERDKMDRFLTQLGQVQRGEYRE